MHQIILHMAHVITHPQTKKDSYRSEEAQRQEIHARRETPPRELKKARREQPKRFPLKLVALTANLVALLGLSWASEGLFLKELLTVSAIVALAVMIHWMGRSGKHTQY